MSGPRFLFNSKGGAHDIAQGTGMRTSPGRLSKRLSALAKIAGRPCRSATQSSSKDTEKAEGRGANTAPSAAPVLIYTFWTCPSYIVTDAQGRLCRALPFNLPGLIEARKMVLTDPGQKLLPKFTSDEIGAMP